ncbi:MAG: hypothetical protein IKM46_06455 [Clostridia bacterium]|nr:hypothetical protein [Clostridia bacterium]
MERENTCPAFLAAANRSYFGIETDVHVTKDGKFVIIHDESTKRVSLESVKVNVEESTWDEIKNIVLPDKDGSFVRQDIRIPLLSEYIAICKKYGKVPVLELKNTFARDDLKRLTEEIDSLGYLESMTFISFSWENCVNLRELLPEAKIQWLTGEWISDDRLSELKRFGFALDIHYGNLDEARIKLLHDNGIEVNCWTCDDPEAGERLAAWGVDYITSNILE